jgi:DNA polymerase-4
MTLRRIIHADLDAFFVSVERVLDPSLCGKSVIVGGNPDRRGVVASASYEARKYGIRSAMPIATARRLCPQAIIVTGNFVKYREYSKKFMTILADFSPFLEPGGLDEAYLDATGFESLYGTIHKMGTLIKKRVRGELGLPVSIGIASCKIVAKVASAASKPDGLLEIVHGKEAAFLAPLPMAKLPGIGKKTEAVLAGLGVKTIGDVAKLPESFLKSHFGVFGEHLTVFARGIDPRPVEAPGEAKSISRETTFTTDTREREFLTATLYRLTERVGADLRGTGKLARTVTLKLRYADFNTLTRSLTSKQGVDSDQGIFNIGQRLLLPALVIEKQPVRLIGISVSSLVTESRQLDMLDTRPARLVALNKAVDGIRSRYGFEAIKTGPTVEFKDNPRDRLE